MFISICKMTTGRKFLRGRADRATEPQVVQRVDAVTLPSMML